MHFYDPGMKCIKTFTFAFDTGGMVWNSLQSWTSGGPLLYSSCEKFLTLLFALGSIAAWEGMASVPFDPPLLVE